MPSRKPKRKDAIETRTALLRAGADVFAAKGFQDAAVRDICSQAGVNLGAISHYFGSKAALYREVLIASHRDMLEREPVPVMGAGDDPERSLRAWVGYALRFILVRRPNHPHAGPLMAREIGEPTAALDELVRRVMRPVRQELERIVEALLVDASAEQRVMCTNFVLGLCVFHELAHQVLKRFGYPVPRTEADVIPLADAITRFALGGIRQTRSAS